MNPFKTPRYRRTNEEILADDAVAEAQESVNWGLDGADDELIEAKEMAAVVRARVAANKQKQLTQASLSFEEAVRRAPAPCAPFVDDVVPTTDHRTQRQIKADAVYLTALEFDEQARLEGTDQDKIDATLALAQAITYVINSGCRVSYEVELATVEAIANVAATFTDAVINHVADIRTDARRSAPLGALLAIQRDCAVLSARVQTSIDELMAAAPKDAFQWVKKHLADKATEKAEKKKASQPFPLMDRYMLHQVWRAHLEQHFEVVEQIEGDNEPHLWHELHDIRETLYPGRTWTRGDKSRFTFFLRSINVPLAPRTPGSHTFVAFLQPI